jgi:S-adenosylmethionine:tRNA ribosyltransferase-isomerase
MSELDHYDYVLPKELIAQMPLRHRADSRLLVVDRGRSRFEDSHIRELPQWVRPRDCLVLNDTRVIPARLVGFRERTGGRWSGLFLEADASGNWRVLGKTRGKLQAGEVITLLDRDARPQWSLMLVARQEQGVWVARPAVPGTPLELLQRIGRIPLPPYIRGGEMVDADVDRYQTVYAERPGAVAAPTAGLHFTPELLQALVAAGAELCRVTLHVGTGTFQPITCERLSEHRMHREWGQVTAEVVEKLRDCRARGGRIWAVGTTVVRVLESASAGGTLTEWSGQTELFIRPPYDFQSVDVLLTNFHLPRSTLLVLVRTFGGDALLRRAYEYAVREQYRFFSYGDAMLIV